MESSTKLALEDRAELIAELCGWADDDWDGQMKRDAAAGRFVALNREAEAARTAKQTRPLSDILRER